MAKVKIAREVLEDLIFGFAPNPVKIDSIICSPDALSMGSIELEISGKDVPDVANVNALCTEQTNRARQRFVTMSFEPVTQS